MIFFLFVCFFLVFNDIDVITQLSMEWEVPVCIAGFISGIKLSDDFRTGW